MYQSEKDPDYKYHEIRACMCLLNSYYIHITDNVFSNDGFIWCKVMLRSSLKRMSEIIAPYTTIIVSSHILNIMLIQDTIYFLFYFSCKTKYENNLKI